MDPIVLVQIGQLHSEYAPAMIAACTAALERGRCTLASRDQKIEPSAVAVVSWDGDASLQVVIEVGTRHPGAPRWVSRTLRFQRQDDLGERWRAVGLTIATLVGDLAQADRRDRTAPGSSAATPVPAAESSQPEETSPSPAGGSQGPGRAIWLALGVAAGPGLDRGPARMGGFVHTSYVLPTAPVSFGLGLDSTVRPRDASGVRVTWLGAAAGPGAHLEIASLLLRVQARVEGVLEWMAADVVDPWTGRSDRSGLWLGALRGGLELVWPTRGWIGLRLGGRLQSTVRPTWITVAGRRVGEFPTPAYTVLLGPELRFAP